MTTTMGYRTRERGGFTADAPKYSTWLNPPFPPSVGGPFNSGVSGVYEIMSDYVTPRFLSRSQQGGIVNTAMSRSRTERRTTTAGPKFQNNANSGQTGDLSGPHWTSGNPFGLGLVSNHNRPTPYPIESMIDIARTRCMANVNKPNFEGLVTLGEIGQTLRYLGNPLKTGLALADSLERKLFNLQDLARKRGRSDDKLRKNLADLHLEVIFGFKPLVKDVASILETLRPQLFPKALRHTARAQEEHTWNDNWIVREFFQSGDFSHLSSYKYKRVVVVRPYILYENTMIATANDDWGIRLEDIPASAWKLMTASFIADWFGNIGDAISAITPRAGVRRLSHGYTVKQHHTLTREVSGYMMTTPGWSTIRDGLGIDTYIEESFYRVPDIGVPTLALRDITALGSDIGKLTSLLSLLTQKLSGLSRHLPPNPATPKLSRAVGAKDLWGAHSHL